MTCGKFRASRIHILLQLVKDRALAFVFLKSLVAAFIAGQLDDSFTELQLILLWFAVILMVTSLGAVTHFRTDRVARDAASTTQQHLRVAFLQLIVMLLSGALLTFILQLTVPHGVEAVIVGLMLGQDLVTTLLTGVKVSIDHGLAMRVSTAGDNAERITHWRTINDFVWTALLQVSTLLHYTMLLLLHGLSFSILQVVLFFNARAVVAKLMASVSKFRTYLARRGALQEHLRPATAADMGESGSTDCSICFEDVPVPEGVVLGCGHVFHGACVRRWLASQDSHGRCPVCRAEAVPGLATPPPEQAQGGGVAAPNVQQYNLGPFQLQFGGAPVGGVGGMFRFGGAANMMAGGVPPPQGGDGPPGALPPLFGGAAVPEASVAAVLEVLPHLDPRSVRATLSRMGGDVNAVVALGLEGGIPAAPPTPPPPVAARHDGGDATQPVGGLGSPQGAPGAPQPEGPAVEASTGDSQSAGTNPTPPAEEAPVMFYDGFSSDEEDIRSDSAAVVAEARQRATGPWDVYQAQREALEMQCRRMYVKRSRARARSQHRSRGEGAAEPVSPRELAQGGSSHAAAAAAAAAAPAAGLGMAQAAQEQGTRGPPFAAGGGVPADESGMPQHGSGSAAAGDEPTRALSPAALRRRQMAQAAELRMRRAGGDAGVS